MVKARVWSPLRFGGFPRPVRTVPMRFFPPFLGGGYKGFSPARGGKRLSVRKSMR